MPYIVIDTERCKGCALCVNVCPKGIVTISKSLSRKGYQYAVCDDNSKCTGCALCALMCTDAAIKVLKNENIKIN